MSMHGPGAHWGNALASYEAASHGRAQAHSTLLAAPQPSHATGSPKSINTGIC